jgi:hypothetical protein
VQIAAPFVPFISEEIYRNLRTPGMPESVHSAISRCPAASPRRSPRSQMAKVQEVVGLARQLRADFNLKVRQPLAALHVVCRDEALLDFVRPWRTSSPTSSTSRKSASAATKPRWRNSPPRPTTRPSVPGSRSHEKGRRRRPRLHPAQISTLLDGRPVAIELDGKPVTLEPADVLIQRTPRPAWPSPSGALVVALETALTPALVQEGHAANSSTASRISARTGTGRGRPHRAEDFGRRRAACRRRRASRNHRAETLAEKLDAVPGAGDVDVNGHGCALDLAKGLKVFTFYRKTRQKFLRVRNFPAKFLRST